MLEQDSRLKVGHCDLSVALEPGSRKKMGRWIPWVWRWNPRVWRWNRIPAKKWAAGICICGAGILQCGAGTRLPQENGALEFLGAALECCCAALDFVLPQKMQRWNPSVFRWNPYSRKIMGRWNPPVFRWNLIPAKK